MGGSLAERTNGGHIPHGTPAKRTRHETPGAKPPLEDGWAGMKAFNTKQAVRQPLTGYVGAF